MVATMNCLVPLPPFFHQVAASARLPLHTSSVRLMVKANVKARVLRVQDQAVTIVDPVYSISLNILEVLG